MRVIQGEAERAGTVHPREQRVRGISFMCVICDGKAQRRLSEAFLCGSQ